ncbi:hypothetical protein R1sor_008909 [Riccia sorocarpa]|uniref:Uncharacterized protein n=1 Tax=Riccia sorocarpa TaxID=122646 RepID=A0ABD3H7J1_9MARC
MVEAFKTGDDVYMQKEEMDKNWYLLDVHILIKTPAGDKLPVAEGLVTFTAPAASMNNTELGELNVGIAVTNLSNGVDPDILSNTPFAAFVDGPMLVSWSLKLVITKKFNRSLYSLQLGVKRDDDDDHQLSRDEGMDDILEDNPSISQPFGVRSSRAFTNEETTLQLCNQKHSRSAP